MAGCNKRPSNRPPPRHGVSCRGSRVSRCGQLPQLRPISLRAGSGRPDRPIRELCEPGVTSASAAPAGGYRIRMNARPQHAERAKSDPSGHDRQCPGAVSSERFHRVARYSASARTQLSPARAYCVFALAGRAPVWVKTRLGLRGAAASTAPGRRSWSGCRAVGGRPVIPRGYARSGRVRTAQLPLRPADG